MKAMWGMLLLILLSFAWADNRDHLYPNRASKIGVDPGSSNGPVPQNFLRQEGQQRQPEQEQCNVCFYMDDYPKHSSKTLNVEIVRCEERNAKTCRDPVPFGAGEKKGECALDGMICKSVH